MIANPSTNKSTCPSWNKTSNGYDVRKSRATIEEYKNLLSVLLKVRQRTMEETTKQAKYVIHHSWFASTKGRDAKRAKKGSEVGG